MDNRDNEDLTARLNAILASAYSGGNSFAARKARAEIQNRDDEGKFAFMFGLMRLIMLQNGIPVATFSRFTGGSSRGDNMGWFFVNSEDGSVPAGFYRYPVNLASDMGGKDSNVQAVLSGDYLASKGVDQKNPSSFGKFPNIEDLEFQETPPDFIEHPDIDGAFISEDGDITIEPNEFGGWDVVDNIDPQNSVQSVDDLGEAMKAVHAIDMTRKDYVPTEFDKETMKDAQLSRARDIANRTPVATLPTDTTPEAPKADPAGMTNDSLGKEVAQFERIYGGPNGFKMDEETKARYDAVDAEWELRLDEHEDQFENPDFIRDPSKSEATAPVATIPDADAPSEEQLAELKELQRRAIADGGLSLSFADGTAPESGYMVSFEAKNDLGIISKADFEDAEKGPRAIFDFLMDNQEFLDGDGNFFGVWFDNDENIYDTDGNVTGTKPEAERNPSYFLDVSQNVADRQEAIDLGIERDQKAIWDVVKQESISTGGTGEGKKDGTDSAPVGQDGSGSDGDSKDSLGESEQELTPDQQKSLDDFAEKLTGMTNGDVRDEGYEISNAYERLDLDEAEPSAFLKAQSALVRAEYDKRQQKMNEESPDTKGYFPQGDIVSGTHGFDNNTTFFYEEDIEGNIAYGRQNYSPDGGLVSEEVFEADSIEDARNKVIAMIDGAGVEVGPDSTPSGNPFGLEGDVTFRDADGNRVSRNNLNDLPLGTEIDAQQLLPGNRMGKANFVRQLHSWKNTQTNEQYFDNPSAEPSPEGNGTVEQTQEIADLLRQKLVNDKGELRAGLVRDKLYQSILDGDNSARYFPKEEMDDAIKEIRALSDSDGGDNQPPTPPVTPPTEGGGFNVTSDADLLTGEVFEKIVDFISRGDEQAIDRVGNLFLSTDIVEDAGMQWIVSYEDADGNTREFVGSLPVDTAGKILQSVDVRADVLGEIESQSKEMGVTPEEPEANVTSPEQLLEDVHMERLDELFNYPDNVWEYGNVRYSVRIVDALDGEDGGLKWSISFVDENGKEYYYEGFDGSIDSIRNEIQSQIKQQKTPAETVTEIAPVPSMMMGSYNLNSIPSATELRRAKSLDGVSETELQDALTDAIKNGKKSVTIGGKLYSTRVLVVALSSRGFDTDMFIAGQLDQKNGNTSNVDALNAYRAQNPDVTREGTDNAKPATAEEALDAFIAGTSQQELVDLYTDAIQNGRETIVVSLENFGSPEALGSSIVEIPLADFRKRLVDKGVDMDSVDDGFKGNDDAKKKIADDMGEDVVDLETGYRSDWRDVILSGSSEYTHIRFLDGYGVMQEFILGEDGKWYDASKPLDNKRLNKGKDSSEMIRYMERGENVDKDEPIYITNGFGYDDSGELIDEAKNSFSFNTPEDDALSPEDAAEVSRWRHITYGDMKKMLKLQKQGVVFDIMDKMQELFPNSERRSDDELVTETHEYTSKSGKDKGTKYKFEVVVTKTPNEYYYTYVRITNTKTGKVQSSRAGRMNQSALGLFRTYRREMTKFHHSFFKTGPVAWFRSGATKIRMKTDEFDEDLGYYTHSKDLQLDRNTTASILTLLGATPSSTQEVDRASDLVMREIFRYISKFRHNDEWMVRAVNTLNTGAMFRDKNLGITKEYLYEVAGAYDTHILNQQSLDLFGKNISFDQRTPLEVGDTVDYVPSFKVNIRRRGKVIGFIGYVDANGGYRYTDYVRVQWDNGQQQITTSRNSRLVETSTGTDGSERVQYKEGFVDPRAGYGTEATGIDAQELLPQPLPPLAPAVKPERQTAQRDENSDLTLPDGTVVPEKPLGKGSGFTPMRPDELQIGDFVFVANEDLQPVSAPVVSTPVVSEDGTTATVKIAVRQSDGTYTVEDASYSMASGQSVMVEIFGTSAENSATPAQLNEILELLATKNASVSGNSGLMNYYLGVMDGKDMSKIYSREEVADIIQELRASPDRTPANPIDQAGELARAVSEDEERNGNPDAAQVLGGLADAAAIVASQTVEPADTTSLAGRVAQVASTMNLGSRDLKQDDRKALPSNSNPADVNIEGTSALKIKYKGTKPTEEASALKDQMMGLGSEAWGLAQQRVVDELRQRGYEGIKTYEDVAAAELALTDAADKIKEASQFSFHNMTNFGYTKEEVGMVVQKMTSDGYFDENGSVDYEKIRALAETLQSDAPQFDSILREAYYSRDGAAIVFAMANNPAIKEKVETVLRNKKKAKDELNAQLETISKFNKDVQIAHDKATVDTLKELGVEFDNVSMSALGIRSSYGGSSVNENSEIGKAIEEGFNRVPRAILLQLAEIMQNNKMQLVVAPFKGRGHMAKRSGYYKIAASREHGNRRGDVQFQSAYENPYTDVFLHELWHVIQEVSPNVAQLEHAWLYDRLVSKDKNGNDILPKLVGANGGPRLGKEKGFSPVNGFVANYTLKQYGDRDFMGDEADFFSPNNKYSEVATTVMQDIFGHHGNSSSGGGMIVYASKHNGRAFATDSKKLFQDEATGKWYTDKEMTDEIKNARTYGRPMEQFDEQVKHFGMGLLLLLSDWSPTQGLGSKSETKKYKAEDLFFDMATGKWYTDSSKTTEIPSADVIG